MKRNSFLIATFIVGMLLALVTLPSWMLLAWPEWTLLFLIYWIIVIPERCGILFSVLIGLFQDSVTASLLGKHVLAYSIIASIVLFAYQKLRMFELWQQAGIIFFLLALEQFVEYWINSIFWHTNITLFLFMPALLGALIWPWLVIFLKGIQQGLGNNNKISQ